MNPKHVCGHQKSVLANNTSILKNVLLLSTTELQRWCNQSYTVTVDIFGFPNPTNLATTMGTWQEHQNIPKEQTETNDIYT